MRRQLGLLVTLTTILIGMLGFVVKVQKTEATGPIHIRPDGSVDPPTTNITSRDNVTYTFTNNIYDSIVVERDNVIVDGNGYALQGSGSGDGFSLSHTNNVTIKNTNIEGFYMGIYLNSAWHNVISRNNITNNVHSGIYLHSSSDNTIYRNNLTNNFYALWFYSSSQNTVSVNRIVNNKDGVFLDSSFNNTISENNISDNQRRGVILLSCFNNTVSGNRIINNTNFGVRLYQSGNNTISTNNLTHNIYGAWFFLSANNRFYHNNFMDNTQQVYIEWTGDDNFWDNGVEGNYWSNYTGVDQNHDGISDTAHVIYANNADNYPLMGMFSSFNTPIGYYVNVVSNSTLEDFEYFETNSTIKIHVSGEEGIGFCRISIPHVLMNVSGISIIIDDGLTPVLYYNYTLYDNGTHRWIYFSYPHSTHEIDIIPEFPSLVIPPLFMTTTLLAVIIYRRKHSM